MNRAQKAKQLKQLMEELELWDELEAQLYEQWCQADHIRDREEIYKYRQVIDEVQRLIIAMTTEGELDYGSGAH